MVDYLGQGGIALNGFTLLNQCVWVIAYTCIEHDQNIIDVYTAVLYVVLLAFMPL